MKKDQLNEIRRRHGSFAPDDMLTKGPYSIVEKVHEDRGHLLHAVDEAGLVLEATAKALQRVLDGDVYAMPAAKAQADAAWKYLDDLLGVKKS